MKKYQGRKDILAMPMTRLEYNNYRGWKLPEDEDGSDSGYLVEYVVTPNTTGKPNHPGHKGYISWSPSGVFEEAYRPSDTWKDRLITESSELKVKIDDLQNAISKELVPVDQRPILQSQLSVMIDYYAILLARLA